MSIEDISGRIGAALEMIDDARAALNRAAEQLDESATILIEAFDGSSSYEAGQALELFNHAQREIGNQLATLAAVEQATQGMRTRLVGTGTDTGAGTYTRAGCPTVGGSSEPREPPRAHRKDGVSGERIEQLRGELPPPVVPNTGQRTHGRWIGPDGRVHREVSGLDGKAREATRVFEEDLKFGLVPSAVTHVEMKVAAHMRKNRIRSVALVINHIPCVGRLSCRKLLPRVLPPGYTLTVHGPGDYRDEYRGSE